MSLVSDMLSKVKMPPPTRETPPGLRADITQARRKKVDKKYKAALAISIVAAFMIIVSAMLFRIYVVRGEEKIADDLHKLKSRHKARLAQKRKSETLSEKIEAALKEPPEKTPPDTGKKKVFAKTPPPALLATAATKETDDDKAERDTEDDVKVKPSESKLSDLDKKMQELRKKIKAEEKAAPPVEDVKEPEEEKPAVIGSKETYHFLYKASRSEKKNDYLGAISIYKKVLEVEPKNHIIMNKIASLLMKMGMWKEAMDQLRAGYKLKQDYVPALINIGIVYANTGNYSRAEKYLLKALAQDPINLDTIFSIALLYEKQLRYDKAEEFYTRLKKLGDGRGETGLERIRPYID
jgi:tetratricopeptide (TPR) repeat protein